VTVDSHTRGGQRRRATLNSKSAASYGKSAQAGCQTTHDVDCGAGGATDVPIRRERV